MAVRLPELPKGPEFEEFISAVLQTAGFYVERNIIDRDVEALLELDIVLTHYDDGPPEMTLVEVKSGEWGFSDIFKMRGWMCYLHQDKALFIAQKTRDNLDFFIKKAKSFGVELTIIEKLEGASAALAKVRGTDEEDSIDMDVWRFSYWVERNLLKELGRLKRTHREKKGFRALSDYYFRVNSGIFFAENITDRLRELYDAFRHDPRISAKLAHELAEEDFDDDHTTIPKKVFEETWWKCAYTPIQISTFVEHRARLAILKNAVDYKLSKGTARGASTMSLRFGGKAIEVSLLELLPPSFRKGLDAISDDPCFARYPIFWQWFLWVFGGFILTDRQEEEYALLASKTGVPVDAIPRAFEVYDLLFPLEEGKWFGETGTSNVRFIKLFPVPFMGVGANYRRLRYTSTHKFEDLPIQGQYTLTDLIAWNNLTIDVLKK